MRQLPILQLGPDDRALFVSDLHLQADDQSLWQVLLDWLKVELVGQTWLFLLGDVFDAWVGDDLLADVQAREAHLGPHLPQLLALLQEAAARGLQIRLVHGNRDFLMGDGLAAAMGGQLLEDPFLLEHAAIGRAVVCHGDQLCTDDLRYQAIRKEVRSPAWQQAFLEQSLADRLQTARSLRAESESYKAGLEMALMDVNDEAVEALLHETGAQHLIHGHTHRPAQHQLKNGRERWVLPDWHAAEASETYRGGGLQLDASGLRLIFLKQ